MAKTKKPTKREMAANDFRQALQILRDFGFVGVNLYHGGPKAMTKAGHYLYTGDIAGAAFDVGMEAGFNVSFNTAKIDINKADED